MDVSNDSNPAWDPYANPPAEQVHTTWDLEGLPHTVTENYAQPTDAGQWTSDAWMTAAATTTLSWASQVTDDASISQSETETRTEYTSAPTDTATTIDTTTATDTSLSTSTNSLSTTTTLSSQSPSATTDTTTTTTTSASSTASATKPPNPSTSNLPTKTKIAIAVPISLIGTALILALLILLLRYRRRHKSRGSGPYMDIREKPSTHVPSHAHSDSQGGNPPNPWDTMTPHLFFLGGTPGAMGGGDRGSSRSIRSSRYASERDVSVYDVTNPHHQQLQGEIEDGASARTNQPNLRQGFLRPSLIVSDGFIPDPLHSHPNTPIMDAASVSGLASASASALSLAGGNGGGGTGTGAIGLARTTTHEPAHGHDHSHLQGSHTPSPNPSSNPDPATNDLERHRPQSPFNHPLDDTVSEISRFSGRRSTFFGGHGAGQGHHYRGVDDRGSISSVSSVSSVSDDEGEDVGRDSHSRRR